MGPWGQREPWRVLHQPSGGILRRSVPPQEGGQDWNPGSGTKSHSRLPAGLGQRGGMPRPSSESPAPQGKQPWLRDTGALSQWPSQAAVPTPPPHPRCAQSQGLEDLATSPHLSCAPPSGSQRPRPHPVSVAGSVSRAGAPPRPQVLSFPGTAHLRSHSSRRLGAEAWGFCSHESKQTVKASFPPSRAQQGWRGALVGQDTAGTGRLGVTG